MKDYCCDCGHFLTLSQVTLRCAECEEKWCREYQAKEAAR